jgi:hypothetical protein
MAQWQWASLSFPVVGIAISSGISIEKAVLGRRSSSMFHLVTTVICPFGTKVFTRLLPPKQNAIQWRHEVADGFPGYTSSGPSAGPPREPLMR